jgi:hypothetical protein
MARAYRDIRFSALLYRMVIACLIASGWACPRPINAATITVLNLKDGLIAGTLRSAIANSLAGDTIVFSNGLSGTIFLTNGGQLLIEKNIILQGPGAKVITISGNNSNRVFNITNANVSLSGLTIANGLVVGTNGTSGGVGETVYGAGLLRIDSIYGYTVTVSNCLFLANSLIGGSGSGAFPGNGSSGGGAYGGAVFNNSTLVMNNCCVAGNQAIGGNGGFGSFAGGAAGAALGSGVCNSGTLISTNCTFAINVATGGSGGRITSNIGVPGVGGNGEGAGVYNAGQAVVLSCTVSSNTSVGGNGGTASPGGVGNGMQGGAYAGGIRTSAGSLGVGNTIVAGNTALQANDVSGNFSSEGFNLVGVTNGSTGFGTNFDHAGNMNQVIDPLLGPLTDHGGQTPTMALGTNSPALDQGNSFGNPTDQRGAPRPSVSSTGPFSGDGSDIGAFELIPPLVSITRQGGKVVLSWSIFNLSFNLQSATNLATGSWVSLGAPTTNGNRLFLTNTISGGNQFYRLR